MGQNNKVFNKNPQESDLFWTAVDFTKKHIYPTPCIPRPVVLRNCASRQFLTP